MLVLVILLHIEIRCAEKKKQNKYCYPAAGLRKKVSPCLSLFQIELAPGKKKKKYCYFSFLKKL